MYDKASNLYNNLLAIYFDKYNELLYAKNKMRHKYDPTKFFLKQIIMMSELKMNNLLKQQEKRIEKNCLIQHEKVIKKEEK